MTRTPHVLDRHITFDIHKGLYSAWDSSHTIVIAEKFHLNQARDALIEYYEESAGYIEDQWDVSP